MSLPKIVNGSWLMACLPARQVHRIRKETTNHELRTIYPDEGRTNRKSKGFTLIELLVVISIIAILMAVATVSYTNAQQKGRDNKRKSDLKAIQQSLELYFQQNGKYPESKASGPNSLITCSGAASGISWGNTFVCGIPAITYMNPLPKDPISNTTTQYYYTTNATFSTYKLHAKIENTNDKDLTIAPATTDCTSGAPATYGPLYYCVINP